MGSFARKVLGGVSSAGHGLPDMAPLGDSSDIDDEMEAIEDVLASLATSLDHDSDDSSSSTADSRAAALAAQAQAVADIDPFEKVLALPDTNAAVKAKLSSSVRRGELNPRRALQASRFVDRELRRLIDAIREQGTPDAATGLPVVSFGTLMRNSSIMFLGSQLASLLRTARERGVVAFEAEILLRGASDSVPIRLLCTSLEDATLDTYTFEQVRSASVRRMSRSGRRSTVRRRPSSVVQTETPAEASAGAATSSLEASLAALSAADSELRAFDRNAPTATGLGSATTKVRRASGTDKAPRGDGGYCCDRTFGLVVLTLREQRLITVATRTSHPRPAHGTSSLPIHFASI